MFYTIQCSLLSHLSRVPERICPKYHTVIICLTGHHGQKMANTADPKEIIAHLTTYALHPSQAWLQTFISSQKIAVPIAALKQTAYYRLIHSDFTISLALPPFGLLPKNIVNASIPERRLRGPIPVQVLDIDDLGRSRWSQVEAIESEERGETTKGREIIRVVQGEEDDENQVSQGGNMTPKDGRFGPYKLLLQDAQGQKVYGLELAAVKGLNLNMSIGTKLVLKDVSVARGVLLLDAKCVTILGGKIDDLNSKWRATRKDQLKGAAITAPQGPL
jgi:RecQ-mediated genome instability protein 1